MYISRENSINYITIYIERMHIYVYTSFVKAKEYYTLYTLFGYNAMHSWYFSGCKASVCSACRSTLVKHCAHKDDKKLNFTVNTL